jgi:hypothetical protein
MADMAKALQAQRDAANAAAQAPSVPPAASTSSHPPADAAPKPASVAMKGTMLGVAPPDVAALSQAMLSKAAAEKAAASAAPAPASAALKGTMLGVAPPDVTELRAKLESERPPAPNNDEDVNAFGGTVVGTSPFFGMNPADEEAARQRLSSASGTGAGGFDPNEATPAEMDGPGAGPSAIAAQYAQRAQERPSNAPDDDLRAPVYRPPGVPGVPARNNAPVILLIGVILVICLLLAAFAL